MQQGEKEGKYMKKIIVSFISFAILLSTSLAPAKANDQPVLGVLGVLTGVPIGLIAGAARGSTVKSVQYADAWSNEISDTRVVGKLIGVPLGLIVGSFAGGITGGIKGIVDGISIGYNDPFTTESYSLEGDFMDIDPYDI